MRVGIVGTGFMGSTHAAGWLETGAELVGFVDSSKESREALAQEYGKKIYPSLETILKDVDVVDICTPTHLHHEMVLKAIEAGKDVVCEKPIARTVAQGQEMVMACKAAGVRLLVAHVVRFFPEYVTAKTAVERGDVGQLAVMRLTRGTFRPKKGIDNWFLEFEKSGGMMLDLMIHDFDYARWVAGEVDTVFAKNVTGTEPGAPLDYGLVILKHRNGTITHIEGAWAYPPPLFRTRFEIAGADGLIEFDSENTAPVGVHIHKQDDTDTPDIPLPSSPLSESPYTTQIKAFYNHLVDGTPLPVSAEDGLAALQIALAAIESAQQGIPIKLDTLPELES